MIPFDLEEVQGFVADLDARPATDEGMDLARLDARLRKAATLCELATEEIRRWARGVFAGKIAFDPVDDKSLRESGGKLREQAESLARLAREAESSYGFVVEGSDALRIELDRLGRLLDGWVVPKLAVGPSARRSPTTDPDVLAEARRRIECLPFELELEDGES